MPRLLIFYHFFHPDDVVSARLYADFAEEQRRRGWEVTVVTSNRAWQDPSAVFPARETWRGVEIRRQYRPPWRQSRPLSRLGNSAFLVGAWASRARDIPGVDAIVVGSDPAFAALLAIPLRAMFPNVPLLHWCFDLYPEAVAAESGGGGVGMQLLVAGARRLMALAYRRCDVLVDIGSEMRRRLADYDSGIRQETLTPWALAEPATPPPVDGALRASLFRGAKLGLLYAGTMGRAHEFELLLRLARACRARFGNEIAFCFACRGNRTAELVAAVRSADENITFAPFASETDLASRLAAADLHLVSLRPEWAGVVVPSKFFGSLAMGRPVVYAGPGESEIARWIGELEVGLHLDGPGSIDGAVDRLRALVAAPARLATWQQHARDVYRERFSRRIVNDRWDELLREVVAARARSRSQRPAPA